VELHRFGFTAMPGRCWRMVVDPDPRKAGQPLHCPEPVTVRGTFRTSAGKRFEVDSCPEHVEGLSP